jgi:hypothetical protein
VYQFAVDPAAKPAGGGPGGSGGLGGGAIHIQYTSMGQANTKDVAQGLQDAINRHPGLHVKGQI